MIVRSSHIITLPSGNLARDFRWESLGYGRVRVQYNYTDRRRAHQTARRYTVEFLNGKVDSICARSANGGRVEYFKTSTILAELLEMLAEFNEGFALDKAVVIATSPWCIKLLGHHDEVKDDSGKGFCLAILNGLDVEEKFYNYFDFEEYWHNNGGDTITTSYGVYMVDTRAIAHWLKELAAY